MMRKYLMTGLVAVALSGLFSSCSKDIETGEVNTGEINILQTYENAFVTRFGQPAENQDWGFGEVVAGTRSGNTAGNYVAYPATHVYKDANGNVIAGANMNHNQWGSSDLQSMPFGGWVVPDPLTTGQKLRVQKYFQANPNLSYQDPHYANFFIQQVYTGGTSAPETGNKEATVGADGQPHVGMTLNQLTVGQACSHINDFNAGTCTPSNVLNHEGKTHSDQITLMVNVDDTSCFGYHETSGSNVNPNNNHNDKMALVSAATIDAWAAANGNPGEAVVDKWNRSFMGFDYELLPESDIVENSYAMLGQVPNINNMQYAWDGTNLIPIKKEAGTATVGDKLYLTSTFTNSWNGTMSTNNEGEITFVSSGGAIQAGYFGNDVVNNWSNYSKFVIEFKESTPVATTIQLGSGTYDIAKGTTKYELDITNISAGGATLNVPTGNTIVISRIYLETGAQQDDNALYYATDYLLGETNKISFYSRNTNMYGGTVREVTEDEMKTTQNGKTCLNLTFFQGLVANGYHPITTDLKTWVKWQAACDGYYSDWIVTLTKAERIDTPPSGFICRIIAEDLTVGENSDFDFNDVVFDVINGGTTIRLRAAGGELPLYVAGKEVHDEFAKKYSGITRKTLVNTGWNGTLDYDNYYVDIPSGDTYSTPALANKIKVVVTKMGEDKELVNIELTARTGKVASKVCVGYDYKWCSERQDIDGKFHKADGTKLFHEYVVGHLGNDWKNGNAWYQLKGQ